MQVTSRMLGETLSVVTASKPSVAVSRPSVFLLSIGLSANVGRELGRRQIDTPGTGKVVRAKIENEVLLGQTSQWRGDTQRIHLNKK